MGLENPIHLAIIAIIVLLLFGAKRLPEMGKSLGSGMRGFKAALSGEDDDTPPTHPIHMTAAVDNDDSTSAAA